MNVVHVTDITRLAGARAQWVCCNTHVGRVYYYTRVSDIERVSGDAHTQWASRNTRCR